MSKCNIEIEHDGIVERFDSYSDLLVFIDKNMAALWGQYFSSGKTEGKSAPLIRYRITDPGLTEMEDSTRGKFINDNSSTVVSYESDGGSIIEEVTKNHKKLDNGVGVATVISTKFDFNGEEKCLKGKYFNKNYVYTKLKNNPDILNLEETYNKYKHLQNWKAEQGNFIHGCLEAAILDKAMPVSTTISKEVQESIYEQARNFVDKLKEIHGEDCEFEVEYPIVAKQVSKKFKSFIDPDGSKGINTIYGFADLLVKDKDGNIHLYDFKTSETPYNRMSSTQKHGYASQLAVYAQMLRQWGIKIDDSNIHVVPIEMVLKTDSEGGKIEELENVNFWNPSASRNGFPSLTLLWNRYDKGMTTMKINQWIPTRANVSISNLDENVSKLISEIFPPELLGYGSVASSESNRESTIQDIKDRLINIRPGTNDYELGFRKKLRLNRFIDSDELMEFGDVANGYLYIMEDKIDEACRAYAALYNEINKVNLLNQGKELVDVLESGSVEILEEYIEKLGGDKQRNWARIQLIPYVKNGWKIISNEQLLANGIIIFSNEKTSGRPEYDIVMLSNRHLHTIYNFAKSQATSKEATSVAGAFFYDDEGIDNKNVLKAEYGNMLLMKAMAYITSNTEFFKQATIRSVRAWNIGQGEETYAGNTMLQRSWTTIMRGFYNKGVPEFDSEGKVVRDSNRSPVRHRKSIKGIASSYTEGGEVKYIFQPDAKALLDIAIDILTDSPNENRLKVLDSLDLEELSLEEAVEQQIMALLRSYSNHCTNSRGEITDPTDISANEDSVAKHYVLQAWLALKGKYLTWEKDMGWGESNITAPAMAESTIARTVNDIMASYMNSLRRDYVKSARDWRSILLKCYEEMGQNPGTMNENKFFSDYFVKNKEKYKLYSLAEFANKYGEESYMYKLMEMFQRRKTKDGIEYSENIPLVKGGPLERLYSQGIIKKVWEDAKEAWNLFKVPIDDEFSHPDYMVLDGDEQTREDALSNHEKGYYSFNLDYVFLHNLQQQKRKYWQIQYDPIFAAVKNGIAFMNQFQGGLNQDEKRLSMTEKWVNDYIKTRYENKSIIDKSLRKWMDLIDQITGLASGVQLWFNSRAMVREMFTSLSIGVTRSLAQEYPTITSEMYKKALERVIGAENKLDLDGMLYQQNSYFGMANMDVSGLADAMKTGRWNFWNLSSRSPYITSSLPDLYYRNAILLAKMIADGVDEAYYIDEDGVYRYHFDKDKRFEILKTGGRNLSKEDYERYLKTVVLYNEIVDDLNTRRELYETDGKIPAMLEHIQVGDTHIPALWDAYTDAELQGIRNYSDKLYGHYNSENEMALKKQFLGHYLLQYRTFMSSRLEQNFQGEHTTNIVHYRYYSNADGKQLYKVMQNDGSYVIKPEDEVSEEDKANGNAIVYMEKVGLNQPGMVTNLLNGAKALIHFKENPEDFKSWWAAPIHRQLLTLFLLDNFVTALLMFVLNWAIGNKKNTKYQPIKNDNWWRRWTYGVLAGSFQDGPIWNLIGQIDSLNPPVISQVNNWYQDICRVLTGDENIMHALVENFGMTREFSHYFDLDQYGL